MHEHETDELGRQICTTRGEAPSVVREQQHAEGNIGQHGSYVVLCKEERKKGLTRPYRDSYRHAGCLEQLVDDAGKDTHQVRLGGCGAVTTMSRALGETYARDPSFYGATFCIRCNTHLPVSEFVWTVDGQQVGT